MFMYMCMHAYTQDLGLAHLAHALKRFLDIRVHFIRNLEILHTLWCFA